MILQHFAMFALSFVLKGVYYCITSLHAASIASTSQIMVCTDSALQKFCLVVPCRVQNIIVNLLQVKFYS